ncbi:hypothetical protein RhiJN_05064 [Ceratobasidium sp. AG-Ba]|nr:hypothetical protein RhiJN_05064 [Ceratobasidium sp. AG-Ba]
MASPEKRVSKKTSKYNTWKLDIDKTNTNSNMYARGKNIRAEEAELAAHEQGAESTEESPVKKAPQRKAKVSAKTAAPRPESPAVDGDADPDDEEARNVAQVKADKRRSMALQFMIHGCDNTPLDKLQKLDLPELEKLWKDGPAGAGLDKAKVSTRDVVPETVCQKNTEFLLRLRQNSGMPEQEMEQESVWGASFRPRNRLFWHPAGIRQFLRLAAAKQISKPTATQI